MSIDRLRGTPHDQCLPLIMPVIGLIKFVTPLPCRAVRLELHDTRVFDMVQNGDEYLVVRVMNGKRVPPPKCVALNDADGLWEIIKGV